MSNERNSKFTGLNHTSVGIPDRFNKGIAGGSFKMTQGNYLGRVVENVDNDYSGAIWVEIIGQQRIMDTSNEEGRKSTFKKPPIWWLFFCPSSIASNYLKI